MISPMSNIQPYFPIPNNTPPLNAINNDINISHLIYTRLDNIPKVTAPISSPILPILIIHVYHVSLRPSPGCI